MSCISFVVLFYIHVSLAVKLKLLPSALARGFECGIYSRTYVYVTLKECQNVTLRNVAQT